MSEAPIFDDDVLDELPAAVAESIASWRNIFANRRTDDVAGLLRNAARDLFNTRKVGKTVWPESDGITNQAIADALADMAQGAGIDADDAQLIFAQAQREEPPAAINGVSVIDEPPPATSPDEYGEAPPLRAVDLSGIPLTIAEWLDRVLPEPDRMMGEWLTTTTRILLNAATGLGKTNFALALAAHIAAGRDFLHWRAHRPARVLFVDGEMSRRLLKRRAQDVCRRCKIVPENLFLLSHEDIDGFQPLNTPAGKAFIEQVIKNLGGIDLVIFDNVMALTAGNKSEEDGWGLVLPLITALTKGGTGQIWVHHTGHDKSRGYGTSTREWRMDTVIHLTEEKRADTDVSFRFEFQKARERTPETRRDFDDVTIALVNDDWTCSAATAKQGKPAPVELKFLEALQEVFATGEVIPFQTWKAVKADAWRTECVRLGLLDPDNKPHSARTLFAKARRELVAHNLIACNNELVWLR